MAARFLLALAILPAFVLMMYIRKLDKIEQEPKELITQLLLFGALTVVSAIILELLGTMVLDTFLEEDSLLYLFLDNFFVVALAEEMGKFVVLKLRTWKDPNFNYTYDAVVYAVAVSLGFAALENIGYVFLNGGVTTAILRAVTAVPGHAMFGIFMGYFYGIAKKAEFWGYPSRMNWNLFLACAVPIMVHGFYDFVLQLDSWMAILLFLLFYISAIVVAFIRVKKLAGEVTPIGFYPEPKQEPQIQPGYTAGPYATGQQTPQRQQPPAGYVPSPYANGQQYGQTPPGQQPPAGYAPGPYANGQQYGQNPQGQQPPAGYAPGPYANGQQYGQTPPGQQPPAGYAPGPYATGQEYRQYPTGQGPTPFNLKHFNSSYTTGAPVQSVETENNEMPSIDLPDDQP